MSGFPAPPETNKKEAQPTGPSNDPQRSPWRFAGASVLAPMEGITHPLYRQMSVARGGLGLVCTEFVRITHHDVSEKQLRSSVQKTPECPLSVQVMGNNVRQMAEAARIVSAAGADVVDINLGCPMPRVVRKGVGAAMLKNPVLLAEVLTAMRQATPGLLSAKIRAGFDSADDTITIARVVEDCGVDFIAVHPRRRCDFYSGTADWRIIRQLKEVLNIPVIGNGDIWYASDALRIQRETGCDAVMLGRPALRNPWIFAQIRALRCGHSPIQPDGAALISYLRELEREFQTEWGARNLVGRVKEMARWSGRAVRGGETVLKQVLRLGDANALLDQLEAAWGELSARELDLDATPTSESRLERSGSAN